MADELPYMRLWVGDLFADPAVRAMDESEFGLYMLALCYAWQEGNLPTDEKKRAKALGVTVSRLRRLWPALEGKWESDGNGGLLNPRQERERSEAKASHRRRVEAGRKGGRAKREA
jgi:uncharacterized protein YdaU (DUF1376 family)